MIRKLVLLIVLLGLISCKKDEKRTEAEKIVAEWMGKEIRFPSAFQNNVLLDSEYKVLLYVDSTGCTDCKLRLVEWKRLIAESDSLFPNRLGFLLFFYPKNEKELQFLFKRERFDYPVFIDNTNQIDKLNHFPDNQSYQCFLLDKDSKVVMIGNPALNPKIWELYKEQITGEKRAVISTTTVRPDKMSYDYGRIKKGSKNEVIFRIENTGNQALALGRVSASCGCTDVLWDKYPVEKGQSAKITVEMIPDETGFNKTIEVFGNMESSPLKLTITGAVTE